MKPGETLTTPFGHWTIVDLAKMAAAGCYYPNNDRDAYKLAMQIVIEDLVLGDEVVAYTADDLASAILERLTNKGE